MEMTKLIFLDIDGVLNRIGIENRTTTEHEGYIGMEPELVKRFNKLVKKTKTRVVLSSTWRRDNNWREVMKKWGLDMDFVGRTPHLGGIRGLEVQEFLKDYPEVQKYGIIDDSSDFLPQQPLFQTSYADGLTAEIADQIEQYFNDNVKL